MGKKINLTNLSASEQEIIAQVIRRDMNLRKNENKRVGNLHKILPKKEQRSNANECVTCGSAFMLIFNPKAKCKICGALFCKAKASCGKGSVQKQDWLCLLCYQERELRLRSLEWFYSLLKTRFRRHGGAKVLRELFKKSKKEGSQRSLTHPAYSLTHPVCNGGELRKEIERTITSSLVSKVEEIQSMFQESSDYEETKKSAENVVDQFFENDSPPHADDELMWRYLKDHKQYLMRRILREASMHSRKTSSVRDAETMTEVSDGELDSLPSCSGSFRSRSSFNNLSDRMRSSSRSLRNSSFSQEWDSDRCTIVQGVVKPRETMTLPASGTFFLEDHSMENAYDDHDVTFNAELRFTAVAEASSPNAPSKTSDSGQSSGDEREILSEPNANWVIGERKTKSSLLSKKLTYLPPEGAHSAYDCITAEDDDGEIPDQAIEEEILPVAVRRNDAEVSAQSLSQSVMEVSTLNPPQKLTSLDEPGIEMMAESLKNDLVSKQTLKKETEDSTSPVDEDDIVATQNMNQHESFAQVVEAFLEKIRRQKNKNESPQRTKFRQISSAIIPQKFDPKEIVNNNEENEVERKGFSLSINDKPHDDVDERFTSAFEKAARNINLNEITSSDESEEELPKQDQSKPLYIPESNTSNGLIQNKKLPQANNKELDLSNHQNYNEVLNGFSIPQDHKLTPELPHKNTDAMGSPDFSSCDDSSDSDQNNDATADECSTGNDENNDVISCDVLATNSPSNTDEPEFKVKTIDEIVRDLQTAGLSAKKTMFNRSSLKATDHTRQKDTSARSPSEERTNDHAEIPESNTNTRLEDVDWSKVNSFEVNPATYKKKTSLAREVSLQSLLSSDNESVLSDASIKSPRREKSKSSVDDDITSLPSVATRRSLFDKMDDNVIKPPNIGPANPPKMKVNEERSEPFRNTSPSRFLLPSMVIIEDSMKELVNPMETNIKPKEKQQNVVRSHHVTILNPEVSSKQRKNSSQASNYAISELKMEPKILLKANSNSNDKHNTCNNFSASSANEMSASAQTIKTLQQAKKRSEITKKCSPPQINPKSSCLNRLSSTEQRAVEDSLAFNRASPFRGSLTMRGSRAGYNTASNTNKKPITPVVDEENCGQSENAEL